MGYCILHDATERVSGFLNFFSLAALLRHIVLSTLLFDMIDPKQMNNSFEFLRTWFLGTNNLRGWVLWNISCPNYLCLKWLFWAVLPEAHMHFVLALLCCVGSGQRRSPVVITGVCRHLRVIYPEEWSKLGKKSLSCYSKVCFSQVRVLFFRWVQTLEMHISIRFFFSWSHIIVQVLPMLINIISNHQTHFVAYLLLHLGK